jgi:hypothetical protein
MADESLRELYARRLARASDTHPDEYAWERLFTGEMSASERQGILDHALSCGECLDVYRSLEHVAEGARAFDADVPAPFPRPRSVPWAAYSGLAAAAVVMIALATIQIDPSAPQVATTLPSSSSAPAPPATTPPDDPGAAVDDSLRGGRSDALIPLVPPRALLRRLPTEFRWKGTADARSYRVRLSNEDMDVLWTSPEGLAEHLAWPANLKLAPGRYYWQVLATPRTASSPEDVVASPLVSFEYRP